MQLNQLLIISIIVIALLAIVYITLTSRPHPASWKQTVQARLAELEKHTRSTDHIRLRQLVIEGDKLLDFCMKSIGLPGETMGERLKGARDLFDQQMYNRIWESHKLRNALVHEINFATDIVELRYAFSIYRSALHQILNSQ